MRLGCGEGIRTPDLRVMSPTSCRCSTPLAKYEPGRPTRQTRRPRVRAYRAAPRVHRVDFSRVGLTQRRRARRGDARHATVRALVGPMRRERTGSRPADVRRRPLRRRPRRPRARLRPLLARTSSAPPCATSRAGSMPPRTWRTPPTPRASAPRRRPSGSWSPPGGHRITEALVVADERSGFPPRAAPAASGCASSRSPDDAGPPGRAGRRHPHRDPRRSPAPQLRARAPRQGGRPMTHPRRRSRRRSPPTSSASAPRASGRASGSCSAPGSAASPTPWTTLSPSRTPRSPASRPRPSPATPAGSCSERSRASRSPACRAASTSTRATRRPSSSSRSAPSRRSASRRSC